VCRWGFGINGEPCWKIKEKKKKNAISLPGIGPFSPLPCSISPPLLDSAATSYPHRLVPLLITAAATTYLFSLFWGCFNDWEM